MAESDPSTQIVRRPADQANARHPPGSRLAVAAAADAARLSPSGAGMSDDVIDEIPSAIDDEIASWRRIMHLARGEDSRAQFRRAALALFSMLHVVGTEEPKSLGASRRAVVDILQEFADFAQIGADDAALIMSEATSPAPAVLRANTSEPTWRQHVIGSQELYDQQFPDVKFIVPGLLPEGVTLLVSRPKLGKSWLLLQIGAAIANGVPALVSADEPSCGDVLYLCLEDGSRRLQRRMTVHFGGRRECWPARLRVSSRWRRLDEGGLQDLRDWCTSVPRPTLIMVDTLKKVRPPKQRQQTDYDADYGACEGLMALASEFPGLAIIVAHHDRKMAADDVFDTVSGTLGLTGGVDTIAILKRSGQGVTLHIQGRDLVDDVEKAVRFDRETCRWTILGEAAEVHRSGERARVLETLKAGELSVGEIMADAGIHSREAAWQLLHRMAVAGEIVRSGRGKYALPGASVSGPSGGQDEAQAADNSTNPTGPDFPDAPDRGGHGKVVRLYPRGVSRRGWKRVHEGVTAPAGTRWGVDADGTAILHAHYTFRIRGKAALGRSLAADRRPRGCCKDAGRFAQGPDCAGEGSLGS